MDASTKFRMSATPTSCRVDGQTGFLACTRALELYDQLRYFEQNQFALRFVVQCLVSIELSIPAWHYSLSRCLFLYVPYNFH